MNEGVTFCLNGMWVADSLLIGKRHPCHGQVQVAVDSELRLRGLHARIWLDGGAFCDCSFLVANFMHLCADHAYRVDHFRSEIDVCGTNTAPNTAFRSFGNIRCCLLIENAIEDRRGGAGTGARGDPRAEPLRARRPDAVRPGSRPSSGWTRLRQWMRSGGRAR